MITLSDSGVRESLAARVAKLHPDFKPRWGRMTPHQAICHLNDSFRGCMGEKAVGMARAVPGQRAVMKWVALYVPVPWPKNLPTRPEIDQRRGGTPPRDWELDRSDLLALIDRFHGDVRRTPHPMFGEMQYRDWMRWAYLHVDHHLRQFGV